MSSCPYLRRPDSQMTRVDSDDLHRAQYLGRSQCYTESACSASHVQDSFGSADVLLQKPAGILTMMVNAFQFSLDKFIVGGVGNREAHDCRRIMDILNRCSFPQQFNESRSIRFFHTCSASIL
jgi:hypothetical protein